MKFENVYRIVIEIESNKYYNKPTFAAITLEVRTSFPLERSLKVSPLVTVAMMMVLFVMLLLVVVVVEKYCVVVA